MVGKHLCTKGGKADPNRTLARTITLHTTTSMLKYSEIYNERVTNYKREKKKTEQLLTALLPRSIIHQLKRGQVRLGNRN